MRSEDLQKKTGSAAEKVIKYISDSIAEHIYVAGSKLPIENDLCQITGVSRSGVREAMKILAASNIVDIRQGDGTYISDPDDIHFTNPIMFKILLGNNTMQELSRFRESMEMAVVSMAITNATAADLERLKEANECIRMCSGKEPRDYEKMAQLDIAFHKVLAETTGNSIMRDVYLFIFEIYEPYILRNYKIEKFEIPTYIEHQKIIRAIEDKDFLMMGCAIKDSISLWGKLLAQDKTGLPVEVATEVLSRYLA